MKIGIINAVCGYSSTGKLAVFLYNVCKKNGHDSKVFYGIKKGNADSKDFVYFGNRISVFITRIFSFLLGLSGEFAFWPTWKLIFKLKKYKPDLVWLYNIHGSFINDIMLLKFLKRHRIPTIYCLIDEYAYLGRCSNSHSCTKFMEESGCRNCAYIKYSPRSLVFDNSHSRFRKKREVYKKFNSLHFVSVQFVADIAKKSILLRDKEIWVSDECVDVTGVYYPRDTLSIKKKLNLKDQKVVLICASINSREKGVEFFLEAAKMCENHEVVFIDVSYGGEKANLPSNFIAIDYVDDKNEMAELYSLADAYVCTSISDTQPNTCLEALGCGTPIIGFNVSGVPYVANEECGTFINDINSQSLAQAIINHPKKTQSMIDLCHNYALKRFSYESCEKRILDFISTATLKV